MNAGHRMGQNHLKGCSVGRFTAEMAVCRQAMT